MAARPSDPALARDAAAAIVRTLHDAGHTAFFAGGCVRDELLGLSPTDFDVATDATPDRISALFARTAHVGASFGVVLVRVGAVTVEVATFRSDGTYTDSRRPDTVTFGSPAEDAKRRDFTVNALFLDPLNNPFSPPPLHGTPAFAAAPRGGVIIDFIGGLQDLPRRVLRAVGDPDQRLREDHLRALRAVRLASRLGFDIEPATADAITRHAADLRGVSRERIGDELRRMFAHPARGDAASRLARLGLLAAILGNGDGFPADAPTLRALPASVTFPLALAAWAYDLHLITDPRLPDRFRTALCLSNDETADLRAIRDSFTLARTNWLDLPLAPQRRAAGGRGFADALILLESVDHAAAAHVRARYSHLAATPPGLNPEPILNGDHLVSLGMRPGPNFRRILDAVYDQQLEGNLTTLPQALELARGMSVPKQ